MKENDYYSLYVNNPKNQPPDNQKFDNTTDYYNAYYKYISQLQKETKYICPSCKYIFDKIFEYRLEGLYKLTEECNKLFNLPIKKNPKERKNGKEKKK